jgi:hypothetical protein
MHLALTLRSFVIFSPVGNNTDKKLTWFGVVYKRFAEEKSTTLSVVCQLAEKTFELIRLNLSGSFSNLL